MPCVAAPGSLDGPVDVGGAAVGVHDDVPEGRDGAPVTVVAIGEGLSGVEALTRDLRWDAVAGPAGRLCRPAVERRRSIDGRSRVLREERPGSVAVRGAGPGVGVVRDDR